MEFYKYTSALWQAYDPYNLNNTINCLSQAVQAFT